MPAVEQAKCALPAWRADEIRDDEDQRTAPDRRQPGFEQVAQIGEGRPRQFRLVEQLVDQPQHMQPSAARREDAIDPAGVEDPTDAAGVEDPTDAVAVAGQQPRRGRDEVDQLVALLGLQRAEVDRWAEIEQEPGRDLAILGVLSDVRRIHPRRDVPVDVADVVLGLVFAQIGEVDAIAVEQAAVIALEQAVELAHDLPVEALQDALGSRRDLKQRGR